MHSLPFEDNTIIDDGAGINSYDRQLTKIDIFGGNMQSKQNDKLAKDNFKFLLLDGSLVTMGRSFIDPSTVVSVFIDIFTGSLGLAGLVSSMRAFISLIVQTFTGTYLVRVKNQPRLIFAMKFTSCLMMFFMIPVLLGGVTGYNAVYIFLALYMLIWAIDGTIVIPWMMLSARTLPHRVRSTVLSYRVFFGGIGAVLCGYLVKWFLQNPNMTDPVRFAWIFGIGAFIMTGSSLFFIGMRDIENKQITKRNSIGEVLRHMPSIIMGNKNFKNFLLVKVLSFIITASAWFVILFGRRALGLNNADTATLIIIQTAGALAGGLIWAKINHRLGTRTTIVVMRILVLLRLLCAVPCFLVPQYGWFFIIIMAFLTGLTINLHLGDSNYQLDIIGRKLGSEHYLVITCIVSIPFALMPLLAGIVADSFGFIPLFAASAIAAIVTLLISPRLLSAKEVDEIHNY